MKSNNCVDKNPPLIGPHLPSTPTQAVEVTSSVNSQNSEVEESSSEAKTGASTSCKGDSEEYYFFTIFFSFVSEKLKVYCSIVYTVTINHK